jgi:phosphate transport system substrate-binding protein
MLRAIFAGTITNWQQVGGVNLPVRVVARTSGSGTRRTFDAKVLDSPSEPAVSSFECVSKNAVPDAPMIRCEVPDYTPCAGGQQPIVATLCSTG